MVLHFLFLAGLCRQVRRSIEDKGITQHGFAAAGEELMLFDIIFVLSENDECFSQNRSSSVVSFTMVKFLWLFSLSCNFMAFCVLEESVLLKLV